MRERLTLDRVDSFGLHDVLRVGEAGLDVLARQVIVLLDDLLGGVAGRQQIHHELHADARAFDDGFADEYIRVGDRNGIPQPAPPSWTDT